MDSDKSYQINILKTTILLPLFYKKNYIDVSLLHTGITFKAE